MLTSRSHRATVLGLTLAGMSVAALTSCSFSDIPGFGPSETPLDTTTTRPPFSPQPWLNANLTPVRSIAFGDTDYSDLEDVRTAIGSARVVMLGEQSRHDGTTFEAKARLVRFLHEAMDFDVLVFESGVYDGRRAWTAIQGGGSSVEATRGAVSANWAATAQLAPLLDYVGAQAAGTDPLALAGMAPEFTGASAGAGFVGALEGYLRTWNSDVLDADVWPAFHAVIVRLATGDLARVPSTEAERTSFDRGWQVLFPEVNRLLNVAPNDEAAFWVTMTLALDANARATWRLERGQPERAAGIRDSSMANTLLWLAQSAFSGRKLIVWSSSEQIMRTRDGLIDVNGDAIKPGQPLFGGLARELLGDVVYSLAFLAGSGSFGPLDPPAEVPIRPVALPLPESWDGLFVASGNPLAFLHLRRTVDADNVWIFGSRVARPLGYQQYAAFWPQLFDGFFFTSAITPASPLN